jgi:hypothetical protein
MGIALADSFTSMREMALHFPWFSRCSDQPRETLQVNGQGKNGIKTLRAPRSPCDHCHHAHSSMGDRNSVGDAITPPAARCSSFDARRVHWPYVDSNLEVS